MSRYFRWQLFSLIALASPFTLLADEGDVASTAKKKDVPAKVSKGASGEPIDLFQAMEQDLVSVDFIPKDATEANVIFRSKSDKPVTIKLPETFAAVPVLAQGGMGMGGMGMGGMGMGGGMFELQPDKARKLKVVTVCLEHGKKDPNPRVKYKMVRLDEFNPDKKVAEVCKALGYGQIQQNTAQAAAWHYANGLSWKEMAAKPRVVSQYTGVQMWFSQFELQNAMQFTQKVDKTIQSEKYTSGESRSESEAIK